MSMSQWQTSKVAPHFRSLRTAAWMGYGVARFLTGVFVYGRAEEFS